jgi:hypothetical protein
MILAQQKSQIVTGTVTVFGNEFYQIGDVVFVNERQMLYYVTRISHSFSYGSSFVTTLELSYGHPVGDYIPTILDIMGKNMVSANDPQSTYQFRVQRQKSLTETDLGTIQFVSNSTDIFAGKYGQMNYDNLARSSCVALENINANSKEKLEEESTRLYIVAFGGKEDIQKKRIDEIKKWFLDPKNPAAGGNSIGINLTSDGTVINNNLNRYKIPDKHIKKQYIPQAKNNLTDEQRYLLDKGIVASETALFLDESLENIVEIRLRNMPYGGWSKMDDGF